MPINISREDEQLEQKINIRTMVRLFSYLKEHRARVALTLCLIALTLSVELFNPVVLKLAIDTFIPAGNISGLFMLGLGLLAANFISMLSVRFRTITMSKVTNSILLTIRQDLYKHIQRLSFSFFDSRPVGKILARIIGDVNSLNDLFTNSITTLIPELVKIAAVLVIMFAFNIRLAAAGLVTLPIMGGVLVCISIINHKRWQIYRKKNSNLNAFTHEDFSGIRIVQSFAREGTTLHKFAGMVDELRQSFMSAVRVADWYWPSVELAWGIGAIVTFAVGTQLVGNRAISLGELVAFSSYISMFWMPIMNISQFYNQLITNITGAERIFEIIDIDPELYDSPAHSELPLIKGDVQFCDVLFSYGGDKVVLDNVSFSVSAGESVAIVGPTGVGKSTIINLLSRFYDSQIGKILIDGYDIRYVKLESLRSQLGIMLQDPFLFSGSIRENIRYGRLEATDAEVEAAAVSVGAHTFIEKLEKGYDTDVNERGTRLSAGQRQLIAIARVLLAKPRILILDEATASIDTQTERLVQEGIAKLMKGRTSFIIAHRLSTIREADKIMVLERGKIVQYGNHTDLLAQEGLYKDLYASQFIFLKE